MSSNSNIHAHNNNLRLYGYVVVLAGIMIFFVNFGKVNVSGWKETTAFMAIYFLSQLLPAKLPQGDIFSITIFLDIALIALFGTPFAVTVAFGITILTRLCSALFGHHEPVWDILKTASQNVIVIAVAGLSYGLVNNRLTAFALCSIVYFGVSVCLLYSNSRVLNKKSPGIGWLSVTKMLYVNYAVLTIMAYTMILVYNSSSTEWRPFSILLFFVPILLISHSFRLYADIRQSYLTTVKTVAAAIEANDPYTKGHSERVSELTLALGKELGFPERELQKLQYVALLHDVGKIGIPERILNKPGSLTEEEYEEIKRHSAIGAEILSKIQFLSNKSEIILYHHEKYDGTGYPAGLKGTDIPVGARILSIADAYNAMTTDRPYRGAMTPMAALAELSRCSGIQFDPELVEKFKVVLRKIGEI